MRAPSTTPPPPLPRLDWLKIFGAGFLKNVHWNFALDCGDLRTDPRSSYTHDYIQIFQCAREISALEVDRVMGYVTAAARL